MIGNCTSRGGGQLSDHQPSNGCVRSDTDPTPNGNSRREDEVAQLRRLFADPLRDTIVGLRKGDETMMPRFTATLQNQLSAFREGEEARIARLEKATTDLEPSQINTDSDPTTNFWNVYKKDIYLLFAGLFLTVTAAFIFQSSPQTQPNPVDLSNVLPLQI